MPKMRVRVLGADLCPGDEEMPKTFGGQALFGFRRKRKASKTIMETTDEVDVPKALEEA